MDSEARKLVSDCREKAKNVLEEHRDKVDLLSKALLEKETLDLKGIIEVLGERPFEMKDNFSAYMKTKEALDKEEKMEHPPKPEPTAEQESISPFRNLKITLK